MKIRSKITAVVLTSGLAVAGIAGSAGPAHAADTTATFTLEAGSLAITVPGSQTLGSVATGSSATTPVQLGSVSVSDGRGALAGSWSTSVTSTDYTTGTASANETISKANAQYWSGTATSTTGVAVFLPGQPLAATQVTLAAPRTAFSASVIVGNNTATWNPTVSVNIPASAVAGIYSGTITHSMA